MFKTNLSRHYSDWAGPPQSPLFCTAPGNFHIAAQRRCFACHRRLLHRCRRPQQPQGPVRKSPLPSSKPCPIPSSLTILLLPYAESSLAMALASSDAGVYGQRALLCCATAVAALHHPAAPESPFAIARARRNCRAPRPSSTRLARSPRSRPTPPALIGAPQLPATPSHQSCLLGDMFSPGRGVLNIMSPAPAPFSTSEDLPASSSPPPHLSLPAASRHSARLQFP
jgi:hypothetical protein